MVFTEPVDFREALQSRAMKAALPNKLSSRELQKLDPELRERSLFAAGVSRMDVLGKIDELTRKIVQPNRTNRTDKTDGGQRTVTEGMDLATARVELRKFLESIGYKPEPGKEGTIQDLRSEQRLNLILETNAQQAQDTGRGHRATTKRC
jgi:hypothetical protein